MSVANKPAARSQRARAVVICFSPCLKYLTNTEVDA
jgi:hypothetical protein